MTKLAKIKILEDNGIEWEISKNSRSLIALCKMSAPNGDDCSEWIDANDMINCLIDNRVINIPRLVSLL